MDAGGKVGRGAAFLIHHAHLHGVTGQAEQVFDRIEQVVGKGALFRPVLLGLDDVDAAVAAVAVLAQPGPVMRADRAGDDGVHDPFRNLAAIGQQDRRIGHQMADIADEQQAAARQGEIAPNPVTIEGAGHLAPALLEGFGQIAADHAQPVAIGVQLVLGIDRGDRILKVADRSQRRFQHHVGNAERVGLADRVIAINHHFDVQAVVAEQVATGLGRNEVFTGPAAQRCFPAWDGRIEELAHGNDHRSAALLVITARPRRRGIERVGAVIGVI